MSSDPFAGDGLSEPLHASRSGVFAKTDYTYASSIDDGITDLSLWVCYDVGCATAAGVGGMPVVIGVHGYAGTKDSLIKNFDGERWASRGIIFVSVGMRARTPSVLGVRDNRGRETQDIIDALLFIRATIAYASATKAHAVGWSDGGGECLGLRTKCDLFTVTLSFFPTSSYIRWYSYWASAPALLEADLGGSPTEEPKVYAAREIANGLVLMQDLVAASSPDGWTHVKHDGGDAIVSATDSQVLNDLAPANWTYVETDAGSDYRALHGHPSDHVDDLPQLEWDVAVSMRDRSALVLPAAGSLVVLGSFVSTSRDFEVWLDADDSTGSPRTNGTGGRDRTAHLIYDTVAQTMRLTPLLGDMRCYVRMGTTEIEEFLSPNATTIFDAAAGTVSRVDNELLAAPTSWAAGAPTAWPTEPASGISSAPLVWIQSDPRGLTNIVP